MLNNIISFILIIYVCQLYGQKKDAPVSSQSINTNHMQSITNSSDDTDPISIELPEEIGLKGPANLVIQPSDDISYDYELKSDLFNTYIYKDANESTGYYYYIPKGYHLKFSAETGKYDININYNSADANMAQATITATLHPKISKKELQLIKKILRSEGLSELVSMPMSQKPDILFDNLSQFGIEPGDISIRAPSNPDSPILLSFSTDNIDELMTMFFNNIGLYGSVVLYPEGENMPADLLIPFELKINDSATFGAFEINKAKWRRSGWQNKTDYPIILESFNVLKREKNKGYQIYTWTMGNAEVPEKAKVNFNSPQVPRWIDTHKSIEKIWMEYSVLECYSCDAIVKDKIIGGVAGSRKQAIEYDVLTPLSFTGAEFIKIKARSFQADPDGRVKNNLKSLRVENDGETLDGGMLYIPEGESPDFEYQIQVVMPDGERHDSDWIKSTDTDVVIGKKQIETHIDAFR